MSNKSSRQTVKKLNVTKAVTYFKDAAEPEAVLTPGVYLVTHPPGGAGYGGSIDQTHWRLTEDGTSHIVEVPIGSLEQIEESPGVSVTRS